MKPPKAAANFKKPPVGPQLAILYSLIDMGTQEGTYQGKPAKPKRKVAFRWELHGEDCRLDDGRPMSIGKSFTLSSSPKGSLRPFIEAWRGKAFTDEEFEAFDLQDMLGKPALLTIVEDGDYHVINGISRLVKGMEAPTRENPEIYLSLEDGEYNAAIYNSLSDKMKEVISQSPEWKARNGVPLPEAPAPKTASANDAPFDDDIPF